MFVSLGFHPDLTGGAYRYVTEVATRLAARGHRTTILVPSPDPSLPGTEHLGPLRIIRVQTSHTWFALNWLRKNLAARRVASTIDRATPSPCWVSCHGFLAPVLAGRWQRTISLFTGPWAEEYLFSQQTGARGIAPPIARRIAAALRSVERYGLRRSRRICTISQYYIERLPDWHPGHLPPIDNISGGADFDRFHPCKDRLAARAKFGVGNQERVLLTVRRLDPRMGLTSLVESFARIAPKHPNARLWLAGRGPQADVLSQAIRQSGLESKARLLGFVPEADLPDLYNAADCCVMPSLDLEGFGLATVESLACGTPVLGSDSGATPELLLPLDRSLVFKTAVSADLDASLSRALGSPESLPSRSRCAEYARSRFSWDGPADGLERALRRVVGMSMGKEAEEAKG